MMRQALLLVAAGLPGVATAAELSGGDLALWWGLPFAGILLSIALCPLLMPSLWHHHFGKIAAAWALAFVVPLALLYGPAVTGASLVHAMLAEYLPGTAMGAIFSLFQRINPSSGFSPSGYFISQINLFRPGFTTNLVSFAVVLSVLTNFPF